MNNIFTEMRIPQLGDANFQTDFTDFCNAMKQNIERLISVQYSKGEPGNSVYTKPIHVGYTNDTLTKLSAGMLGAIFDATFTTSMGPQNVYDMIAGAGIGMTIDNDYFTADGIAPSLFIDGVEYKVIPSLMNNTAGFDVEINIDDITGEAYLSSPYIFIDNRIAGLNRMVRRHAHDDEIYKMFHDFSVAIYGKGTYDATDSLQDQNDPTTWDWEFEAVQIVPKLYFDDNINEFCWDVNGQQTAITAQGIKGDDGSSPNVIIAIGRKTDAIIILNKIQAINENGDIVWASRNSDGFWGYDGPSGYVEIEQPKTNDLVLVFFPAQDHTTGNPNNPYEYAYLGKVYAGEVNTYTYIGYDEDGRCDIFESIKLHDHWSLMLSINEYTTGAPRGYLLPATPGQSPIHPDTNPTKVHMTYSEKGHGSEDARGFAKLHSAPVSRDTNPDPTKMSQTGNPPTHHIGDWTIDYNVGIQGTSSVQGDAIFHSDITVQGNGNFNQNVNVQGDINVQGSISGGQGFTITGIPFETVISSPKIACMSRFKNVAYSLKRMINSSDRTFGYAVAITGELELNVGVLSYFNHSDSYSKPHEAISGYGPNWSYIVNFNGARRKDEAATTAFDSTGCKQHSKLYNVVKYTIPFDITKEVVSQSIPYNSNVGIGGRRNIWGFKYYGNFVALGDTPQTIYNEKNNAGQISLRSIVEGFNMKKITGNGSYDVWGSEIINTMDIDCVPYRDASYLDLTNPDEQAVYGCGIGKLKGEYTANQTHKPADSSPGIVTCLSERADGLRNISKANAQKKYAVYGKIRYAPYKMEFEYYFDLFPRIFEVDYTSWKTKEDSQGTIYYYCSDMDYNIFFDVVPYGFIRYKQPDTNKEFHAPIWNAINVNNERSNSIRANISELNISLPNITVYDPELEETERSQGEEDENDRSIDDGLKTSSPPQPTPQVMVMQFYSLANSLISNLYTKTFSQSFNGNIINGPQSVILSGEDIESQYIIGLFDNPIGQPGEAASVEVLTANDVRANYFDITPSLRIVENNVKICPNNSFMGTWRWNSNETEIQWESAEPVPYVIIPYEGYVGRNFNANTHRGHLKIGCGNFKSDVNANGSPVTLDGVLVYPFTPCVIMRIPKPNTILFASSPIVKPNEPGISSNAIEYVTDDLVDAQNDASQGGKHWISNGRMLVTDGQISGIVTKTSPRPTIVVDDWVAVESLVTTEAQAYTGPDDM